MKLARYLGQIVFVSAAMAAISFAGPGQPFRFVDGKGFSALMSGADTVYRLETAFDSTTGSSYEKTKKVFHHVYGMQGEGALTKGAGGLWGHHRGIWLGWSSVIQGGKDVNYWECPDGNSQRHEKFLADREWVSSNLARRASVTAWIDNSGITRVRDTREVTAWIPEAGQTVLDFRINILAVGDSVQFKATPHHGGVSFRSLANIADSDYVMAPAIKEPADVFKVADDNAWVYGRFTVKERRYGVLLMDHPSNTRPARLTRRDYGRFGSYWSGSATSTRSMDLSLRFVVLDLSKFPALDSAKLQAMYYAYSKASPASTIPATEGPSFVSGELVRGNPQRGSRPFGWYQAATLKAGMPITLDGRFVPPGATLPASIRP